MGRKLINIRCFCVLLCFLMIMPFLNISANASDSNYKISGNSYELSGDSGFNISGKNPTSQTCYGSGSIGELVLSGSINDQTTYNNWDAIGTTGAVSLTYTYNGAYQTGNKDSWNISSSTEKTINGNDINKKIEKGAIVVECSPDGKAWDTVYVKTNVFNKVTSNIADFYTISEEDVRSGCYYRVSVAYMMEKRTDKEKIMGFIPKDKFEYREFVEISEFYICYNANAVVIRDLESGQKLSSNNFHKGFIVDKCGTDINVVIKDNATGKEKIVSDLTSITDPGSYKIITTTNLGKKYSSSITVTNGINMSSVSPAIYSNDKYQLDPSGSKAIPFGMSSLTTLKLGYQIDARLTSDSVSGFNAYGITGDNLSLFLRIKDFSESAKNGWTISSDAWGKKEKQTVGGTWAGAVGTGALVIQTSIDGKTWNDVTDGKYNNGIYTTDFYSYYADQGDILIYTPDGKELQRGVYIRVLYAYQVGQADSKEKTRILEAYEMYLCSNELGAVTFHNLSITDNLKDTLGLDNEADVEVYKKAETLVSGSGTVTGFSIDTSLNPTVKYTITHNGSAVPKARDNRYTTNGKYDIRLESAVGTVETITIYVDSQSNESALNHYFGNGFITSDSKRIYSDGEYPVYEGGLVTLHVEPNKFGYLPIHGTVQNESTGNSFDITSGTVAVNKVLEEPGQYVATFTTRPADVDNALPGDYRVFTFRFKVIANGTAPGPVVNKENLLKYAKTTATDAYPKFYGLTYPSAAAGDITLAFATKEAAVEYAYNYEKGTVEVQADGSYRYTGSFLFSQKEKYDSAWDLTDAMYYFAEQAVQELQFDLSDQFTYLTLSEDIIKNTSNLRTLELRRSVTIFGEEQREFLCNIDALPIISPKPYAYLTPGSNGKVDEGYMDFEFVSDKYGCDSSSVIIIDSSGKEYEIAYNMGVGQQLADASCPSGIVTIKEKTVYGDESIYEAVYIAAGENTASISLTCYKDGEKLTKTYTQADDGASITVDAFELSSIVDSLDPFTTVMISDSSNSFYYVADQLATGAWSTPDEYDIVITNRLGHSYSIAVNVIESNYASVVFTGEGTEDIKAIVTQFGEKNVALPTLDRYGYVLTGFEDEHGNLYANEISEIMFKGTTILNAVWEAKQYTLHFHDTEGNDIVEPMTIEYGREYELPTPSLNDEVVFLGWTRDGDVHSSKKLSVDQEGDIILVASLNDPNYVVEQPAETEPDRYVWIVVIAVLVLGAGIVLAIARKRMEAKALRQTFIEEIDGGDEE